MMCCARIYLQSPALRSRHSRQEVNIGSGHSKFNPSIRNSPITNAQPQAGRGGGKRDSREKRSVVFARIADKRWKLGRRGMRRLGGGGLSEKNTLPTAPPYIYVVYIADLGRPQRGSPTLSPASRACASIITTTIQYILRRLLTL